MVVLHVKHKDKSLFLIETTQSNNVKETLESICFLYNGKLKIHRLCQEIEELSQFGPIKTDASMNEVDAFEPDGGSLVNIDPNEKRCGKQPNQKMTALLLNTVNKAKKIISDELVKSGDYFTQDHIQESLDILKGAITIVYPNGLPPQDPIFLELQNKEELTETDHEKEIFDPSNMQLWFASKELVPSNKLGDHLGKNEKTKVIIKIQRSGSGAPMREPSVSEAEYKKLLMDEFKRREVMKKLESDSDNSYLNSEWADSSHLKKSFHGLQNLTWKPK